MPVSRPILLVLLAVLVGCGTFRSTITTGPDGLRTFSPQKEVNGQRLLCNAAAALEPVVGTLRGRAGAKEPVWIVAPDGEVLSVVWPAGFLVRFDPDAVLYNDREERLAVDGDQVALHGVSRKSRAGSYEDPLIASGIVYNGCYHFAP